MMATVSIIIPAYNPGPYLREALRSIERQTFADWEVVVIDDNSSEDLSWIPREFPRVRWIRQGHGGVSVARNNGILNTSGPLIAFMDQDDLWRPGKLERQVAAMTEHADAAVCYCDLSLIDEAGRPFSGAEGAKTGSDSAAVVELDGLGRDGLSAMHRSVRHFSSRFVVPSTVMIRRSCLATSGLLDPFIPFSGDYDLLIKLGGRHKVVRVPASDVLYRKHSGNFSDQYEVGRREVKALIARYVCYARGQGDARLAREARRLFGRPRRMYAAQAIDRSRRSLRAGHRVAFMGHLGLAFWFSPVFATSSVARWFLGRVVGKRGEDGC